MPSCLFCTLNFNEQITFQDGRRFEAPPPSWAELSDGQLLKKEALEEAPEEAPAKRPKSDAVKSTPAPLRRSKRQKMLREANKA